MDNMNNINNTQRKILLLVIIIILGILIYKIYIYSELGDNKKEGFTSTGGMATDLLTKLKSYEAQTTKASNPADLELSIYPWTTKLYNLQSQNQVRAIGLYKPQLSINGKQYAKLGDMLSLHNDYTPPDNTENALLIGKIGSDIKAPVDYTKIISMGNDNLPNYYYQLDNLITPNLAISTVSSNLVDCMNSLSNLNTLLQNNNQSILDGIKDMVYNNAYLKIGNAQEIKLATIKAAAPISGNIVTVSINSNTSITIPVGVGVSIFANNNGIPSKLTDINFGEGLNFSQIQTINTIMQSLSSISIFNFSAQNIILNTYTINAFSYINPQNIIDYLNNLCNDISTILNLTGLSQDFANYLNLADSIDGVTTVMAALSTLTPTNATDSNGNKVNIIASNSVLSSYASINSRTLLGGILNLIINYNKTIKFPSLRFTPEALTIQNLNGEFNTTNFNNLVSKTNLLVVKSININILDSANINLSSDSQQLTQNITSNNIPNLSNLIQFNNAITNNAIEYFPLQIYAPVAPNGYQSLGHVFCNVARDLTKIKTMNNIACVPSGCVKEIRDWTAADKVFEYNRDGMYWALYKNPYIGTFTAVSKLGFPEGKVCKVVACVAKCTAVDELKKAEQCARTYQTLNKNISSNTLSSSVPDLVANTEEDIYLQKIKTHNDNIITLQNRARQLQTDIDKADVITEEMHKTALQNYVDKQKRNIELVADRLELDQNKIQTNINIPYQVLNQIITIINNLPNLAESQKADLTNKIIKNAQAANSGLLTSNQYNANLNNILRSCPQYDLTGLVKKSVVSDVCYGCGTPE